MKRYLNIILVGLIVAACSCSSPKPKDLIEDTSLGLKDLLADTSLESKSSKIPIFIDEDIKERGIYIRSRRDKSYFDGNVTVKKNQPLVLSLAVVNCLSETIFLRIGKSNIIRTGMVKAHNENKLLNIIPGEGVNIFEPQAGEYVLLSPAHKNEDKKLDYFMHSVYGFKKEIQLPEADEATRYVINLTFTIEYYPFGSKKYTSESISKTINVQVAQ